MRMYLSSTGEGWFTTRAQGQIYGNNMSLMCRNNNCWTCDLWKSLEGIRCRFSVQSSWLDMCCCFMNCIHCFKCWPFSTSLCRVALHRSWSRFMMNCKKSLVIIHDLSNKSPMAIDQALVTWLPRYHWYHSHPSLTHITTPGMFSEKPPAWVQNGVPATWNILTALKGGSWNHQKLGVDDFNYWVYPIISLLEFCTIPVVSDS